MEASTATTIGHEETIATPAVEAWGFQPSPDASLSLQRQDGARLGSCPYSGGLVEDDILRHFQCRGGGTSRIMVRLHDWKRDKNGETKFLFHKFIWIPIAGELLPRSNASTVDPQPAPPATPGPSHELSSLLALMERRAEAAERRAQEASDKATAVIREMAEQTQRRELEMVRQRAELAEQQRQWLIGKLESMATAAASAAAKAPTTDVASSFRAKYEEARELCELVQGGSAKDPSVWEQLLQQVIPRLVQAGEMYMGHKIQQEVREASKKAAESEPARPAALPAKPAQSTSKPAAKAKAAAPAKAAAAEKNVPARRQVRGRLRGRR